MEIVLDTNVLLRMTHPPDPLYRTAVKAEKLLLAQGIEFLLLPQTIYEFWVVSTRPTSARGGLAQTPAQTRRRLRALMDRFDLRSDPPDLVLRWQKLCLRNKVEGVGAHDARLVAAMQAHGIAHILTFNGVHFTRYKGLTILDPAKVVAVR